MTTKFKLTTVMLAAAVAAAAPLAAQTAAKAQTRKDPTATTTTADKGGWIPLFDGKDLAGWRGYKKTDAVGTRWKVVDGLLTIPGTGAGDTHGQQDIISDATF